MQAVFATGFRPFFLGATLCATVSMGLWMAIYGFAMRIPLEGLTIFQWHAHEMIFGYAMAVIAGFLLTAVRNWTNLPTLSGTPLAVAFGCWALARLLFLGGTAFLALAAVADLLFTVLIAWACAAPILRTRQWRQMGVLTKLVLLGLGNLVFYAGAFGWHPRALDWSLLGSLYLVIGLIMTMGRRLIPFFTERGVEPPVRLRNSTLLDLASLVLFLVFWIAEVFLLERRAAALACAGLFVVNTLRLVMWYTPGILAKPLLWSLFASFAAIDLGFLLYVLGVAGWIAPSLALHTFAVGGIGLITVSMMARVALGHTGRSVHAPPRIVLAPIALLALALVLRVAAPAAWPAHYAGWIVASQAAWIAAFAVFLVAWWPMFTQPRVDGATG